MNLVHIQQMLTGIWPLLWHSTLALSVIAILVLVGVGSKALEATVGDFAMKWIRDGVFVTAGVIAVWLLGYTMGDHNRAKADRKVMQEAVVAGVHVGAAARARATRDVTRGVCDDQDLDCAK